MEAYEVLEKALALIEDERNWCQWDRENYAGQRCAVGALEAAAGEVTACGYDLSEKFGLEQLLESKGFKRPPGRSWFLSAFNDSHSHAEVVELFQTAIREEKRKAGITLGAVDTTNAPTQQLCQPEQREKASV
jgi:hypothetical protein